MNESHHSKAQSIRSATPSHALDPHTGIASCRPNPCPSLEDSLLAVSQQQSQLAGRMQDPPSSSIATLEGGNVVYSSQSLKRSTGSRGGPVQPNPATDNQTTGATGQRPVTQTMAPKHQCTICGKEFTRKFNLQSHLRTHSDKCLRFQCEYPGCAAKYSQRSDLQKHIVGKHKGLKVHKCPNCGKRFERSSVKARHVRNVCGT